MAKIKSEQKITKKYFPRSKKIYEIRYLDGNKKLHRKDGPAVTIYYRDGQIERESWYIDGNLHRIDGPAMTTYYENKRKIKECWYMHGALHRTDGPAIIEYRSDGHVAEEKYMINNAYHRTDGPAIIEYSESRSKKKPVMVVQNFYESDEEPTIGLRSIEVVDNFYTSEDSETYIKAIKEEYGQSICGNVFSVSYIYKNKNGKKGELVSRRFVPDHNVQLISDIIINYKNSKRNEVLVSMDYDCIGDDTIDYKLFVEFTSQVTSIVDTITFEEDMESTLETSK